MQFSQHGVVNVYPCKPLHSTEFLVWNGCTPTYPSYSRETGALALPYGREDDGAHKL